MASNITHGSAFEPSMDELREQLSMIQRIAAIGMWKWDLVANVVQWSKELHEIYGTTPATFVPSLEGFLSLVHPEDRDRVVEIVQAASQTGAPFEFDHRIVRPDGELRVLHAQGHGVKDQGGRVVRMYGTGQDVTQLRRAQESEKAAAHLLQVDAFKSEFISNAAHELRTPLLPIRVQTHILGSTLGPRADPRQKKALESLERNLDRLNRLVDDLLEASRIQSRRIKLEKHPFDLALLVDEALDSFQPVAKQLGLTLNWRPRRGLVVEADPSRILQVLHNILGNAMKFTPAGGTVTVELEPVGSMARLSVRDTGAGIAPDEIRLLFQPFSRTSAGKESRAPGTGLGLYVTRGIMEEHGGTVRALSEGKGKGAVFAVELPLTQKAPQAVNPSATAPEWWRDATPSERMQRFKELI